MFTVDFLLHLLGLPQFGHQHYHVMGLSPSHLVSSRPPHCPEEDLALSIQYCQIHTALSKWAFRTDTAEWGASQAQHNSTQEVLWCNIKSLHVRLSVLQITIQNLRGFYFDKLLLTEQDGERQNDALYNSTENTTVSFCWSVCQFKGYRELQLCAGSS